MDVVQLERLARIVFQSTREALLVFVPGDGRLCDANPAAERLICATREQLIGRTVMDFVSGSDPDTAMIFTRAIAQGESSWEGGNLQLRRNDGTRLSVRVRVEALEDGGIPLRVAICTPEPEAAWARERIELRRAQEIAEAAHRAKSEFLAAFSHELRIPLTTILGLVDLVMEGVACASAAPDHMHELRAIQQNGRFLLDLVNELLDLAKYEVGKLQVTLKPCAPDQVVSEVTTALRPRAEAKGLRLEVEYVTPIPAGIATDALRLRQILMNLLSNAIKFTERGGVRVRIALDTISASEPELNFEVTDSGIGITEADQARLFEPFFRAAAPEGMPDVVGTGLGLALSRRMAEILGGRLTARSQPGQGSTFTLTLPAGPARGLKLIRPRTHCGEEVSTSIATILPLPAIHGRVLLADDNESNRRIVALRLKQTGTDVVTVANGREAIDAVCAAEAEGSPFDLILMDLQMPVLDGYEATRQLRDLGFRQPIIALTAHARVEDREECLRFGCDDHISKPLDWDQLRVLLAKYLKPKCSVLVREP